MIYILPTFLSLVELIQNATIEERVSLLEIQVAELEGDVTLLEENVNFLFDETVIQDERLLILEQDSDVFDDEIESECFTPTQQIILSNDCAQNQMPL